MRLGILPAAGKAERWGGYPKELLPISETDTLMSRAVQSLKECGCDSVLVVTNPGKIQLHAYHLKDWDPIHFVIQQGRELWGAVTTAIQMPVDEYYFMMPDTYLPQLPFPQSVKADLCLGLFSTNEPERFGVLRADQLVDKQAGPIPCLAWGVLAWRRSVAEFWRSRQFASHTDAINSAIRAFGYSTWHLDYYYDMGSMDYYRDFLLARYTQERTADDGLTLPEFGVEEPDERKVFSG